MKNLFIFLFTSMIFIGCDAQSNKINAVSFVASGKPATQQNVNAVKNINANYAAVMPFGFIRDLTTPKLQFNSERQWFGETVAGTKQYIEILHKNGIAVMIKPQIWIWHGEFTGYLKMTNEEDWKTLEKSYREFIITYAKVAAETKAEILCIGTELEQFTIARPQFWNKLIAEIKTIYKGKLTYAANWDEYKRVSFWNAMDYIGVDAYFPLSEAKTPTVAQVKIGWQPWKAEMAAISETHAKPILFTEYGYRSVDFSGKEPWLSDRSMTVVNMEAQTNLTQALFDEFYHEPWFSGGFIWKWFIDDDRSGGMDNNQFTPQNKPVELIIKKQFEK